jgi:2,3-bisphosphoglycerate-independent phosphoglycerate mutase
VLNRGLKILIFIFSNHITLNMTSKKLLFIILDGVAGRSCEEFNDLTPLEAANTPNLDYLAKNGQTGETTIIDEETPPETDTAVLALFGYDPIIYSRSRGPLEAVGIGINFNEGDLALRCNFATVEDGKIVDTRAGRINTETARKLVDFIQGNLKLDSFPVNMNFIHTLNYRTLLILHPKKGKLSDQISNTNPGYERLLGHSEIPKANIGEKIFEKCKPLDDIEESLISVKLVNEFTGKSHELLKNYEINLDRINEGINPANFILMRGAGTSLPKLDKLQKKYGTNWICIGDTPGERGIAKLLGMDLLKDLPDPYCDMLSKKSSLKEVGTAIKKDMQVRVRKLLDNFEDYDCFYVHIKGADPFGHVGLPEAKKKIIEGIDKWFFGELLKKINLGNTKVCVTSDHSTPCSLKAHSADPVPLLISGHNLKPDSVEKFGENFCKKGNIGRIKATQLMSILMG